ncbi:MAG: protein YgfX [Pseudomonadota bacterium]
MRNQPLTFRIECTPSKLLARWITLCYACLFGLFLLSPWAVWFKSLVTFVVFVAWGAHRRRVTVNDPSCVLLFNQAWSPFPWCVLSHTDIQFNHINKARHLSLQGRSRLLGPLVFLYFKDEKGRKQVFVLMADSMSKQHWAMLRRWMLLRPRVLLGETVHVVR